MDSFRANHTKFTCLDNSDIFFQGTLISPIHSFLHFEILACEEDLLQNNPGFENESCASEKEIDNFFARHILVGYVSNTFVNKTMFSDDPIVTLKDIIFYE